LLGDADSGETPLRQAFSIIRGIGTKAELRAWRAVERQLDRGPRDAVVDRIEHRLAELDEHGERPPLGPDRDDWTAPATSDTSGPSFIEDVGGLDGGDDAEAQKLGTGRLCDTPMSGSPPDDWTLPDGMEPVAPAATETDDGADDADGGESAAENTLAAALGGDGR
jgi:hypothetical protein